MVLEYLLKSMLRMVEKWFSFYNVKNWGAKGDGIANDTQAFKDLFTAAAAGGTCFVPDGTYLVTVGTDDEPQLELPSKFVFRMSKGAVLKAAATNSPGYSILCATDVSNVEIVDGTIEGDRDEHMGVGGESGMGIWLAGARKVTIRNVTIKDCWGDGIYVAESHSGKECENITIDNCYMDHNRRQGITVVACLGGTISDTTCVNTSGRDPSCGIDIEADNESFPVHNIKVVGCHLENNTGGGIMVCGPLNSDIAIVGNTSKANGGFGIRLSAGCSHITVTGNVCESNTTAGIRVESASNNTVTGNVCRNNTTDGISIYGTSVAEQDCNVVAGNECFGNGEIGINLNHAAYCSVTGNVVRDNSGIGVAMNGDRTRFNAVAGNVIRGNERGILLYEARNNVVQGNMIVDNLDWGIAVGSNSNDNVVTGNQVIGNSARTHASADNIQVSGSGYNLVQGNLCREGANANKPAYGIEIYDATAEANMVINNDLYASGVTGNFVDSGTGTIAGATNRTG